MKYLREFLKKLPENHFKVLSQSGFTNTEFDLINHYRNDTKDVSNEFISGLLSIKLSTLKKLQSSLFSKVITLLTSEDIFEQIPFLSQINCHKILIHICKKNINTFKKEGNIENLLKTYRALVYNLLSSIISDYDIKELKLFRKNYLKLSPESNFDSIKFEIILLILEMMQLSSLNKKDAKYFKKKIENINTKNIPELEFWKNKLKGDYFEYLDEEKYIDIVKKNYELITSNKLNFDERIIVNTKLQYMFYLVYNNKFIELYEYYNSLKNLYPSDVGTFRGLRYVDLYSQVCIFLGKYQEARASILNAYPIEDEPGKFAQIYFGNTTILAMIDIIENQLEKAHKKILAAKIGLKKNYFAFLDSLLRLVEQAYYLKNQDFDFADSLHKKNIKFYQYHNIDGLEIMESGHKILNFYSKTIFEKTPLTDKYKTFLSKLKSGEFCFIGHFIEKLDPNL